MSIYRRVYIVNAISLNMFNRDAGLRAVRAEPLSVEAAQEFMVGETIVPAIGHAETAVIAGQLLQVDYSLYDRRDVVLEPGDALLVAQYTGDRLPAGATQLPPGASIGFWGVEVDAHKIKRCEICSAYLPDGEVYFDFRTAKDMCGDCYVQR